MLILRHRRRGLRLHEGGRLIVERERVVFRCQQERWPQRWVSVGQLADRANQPAA